MNKPIVIITAADHARLSRMLALSIVSPRERGDAQGLKAELAQAQIVTPEEIPADVITMNSRAELLDLETGERMELTVVFPDYANIDEGRISVLAPVGAGMLGYRVGDVFASPAPYGVRRLQVTQVQFQPEAALATASA